jgi:outer membrane lipoprotein-sorting protein
MKRLFMKKLIIMCVIGVLISAQSFAQQDMEEVVANLQESLDLSDKQVTQVQNLMVQYRDGPV